MLELLPESPLHIAGMLVVLWAVVCYLVSWVSGWRDLGDVYEDRGAFRGERFYMRSGSMKHGLAYENCLFFSADTEGLRLRVLPLFRPGHPPLFVPWTEITVGSRKSLFADRCVFSFDRVDGAELCIPDALAEQLLASGRGKYKINLGDGLGQV